MVSLTHGRPAIISAEAATEVPFPQSCNGLADFSRIAFFTKSIELYEIINRTTMAVYSAGASNEDLASVIEIDEDLSAWKHGLPEHLQLESLEQTRDEIGKRQAVILRIR